MAHQQHAWDCDPTFTPPVEDELIDIDEEDASSDWQIIALDRWGDRRVNGNYYTRRGADEGRCFTTSDFHSERYN